MTLRSQVSTKPYCAHNCPEQALVLPETGADPARVVARRVRDSLANDAKEPRISASVGVAIYPGDGRTIEHLLLTADRALYKMKGMRTTARVPVRSSLICKFFKSPLPTSPPVRKASVTDWRSTVPLGSLGGISTVAY